MDPVEEFLAHHGVKGMKWGVTKAKRDTDSLSTTLKDGSKLSLEGGKTPFISRALARVVPGYGAWINKYSNYSLKDPQGKKVGELSVVAKSPEELNVIWVEVNDKSKGRGYASAAMRESVNYAKSNGFKKVTLEVPGISPDARHIYEKMGFKAGKQLTPTDDMWGGLTAMELKIGGK